MKPYTICYMMTSLDGRIDCAMTEQIEGGDDYYQILTQYHFDSYLSGKITAVTHYAKDDKFISTTRNTCGHPTFYKVADTNKFNIILDTKGTLEWDKNTIDGLPILMIVSEDVSLDYLAYLKWIEISYIAVGKGKIDLEKAMDILAKEFKVERLGVVGGGLINAAFLEAGLLDEISILIGPAIDGRKNQRAVFDGLALDKAPTQLTLKNVTAMGDGAVLVEYLPK